MKLEIIIRTEEEGEPELEDGDDMLELILKNCDVNSLLTCGSFLFFILPFSIYLFLNHFPLSHVAAGPFFFLPPQTFPGNSGKFFGGEREVPNLMSPPIFFLFY